MMYYSNYCEKVVKEKIENFIETISINKITTLLNNLYCEDINDIFYYFYIHTGVNGEIISFNTSLKQNKFIFDNKDFFKNIEKIFLDNLFKNEYPLYFLDVDNTLTDRGYLSNEKIDFITTFKHKKNIILSTGKVSDAIMNVINDCKLNDNYYSCLNGSVIFKNEEFTLLNKIGFCSKEIIKELKETNVNFITYYYDRINVVKELAEEDKDNLERFNEKYFIATEPLDYEKIVKILTFINDDGKEESKAKENIVKKVISKYPDLHCVRTAPHCFEILRRDQHKGNSVKRICELMGVYYRHTIGVGDSMNDLPMLEYTGIPFVVSNVSNELKEYDFEILKGNRNIDIVNLLKRFG